MLSAPPTVLVKILDSCSRLMIQTHPNDEQAQSYFGHPYGKTEAWYVLGTRINGGEPPYVLLGFKEEATRAKWAGLFERQDVAGMIACLNKIEVKPGDCFYVPANVPHAMGSGVFFAEVQQPADITLRTERVTPGGDTLDDNALHQGAGFDVLLECFDYKPSKPDDYRVRVRDGYALNQGGFSLRDIRCTDRFTLRLSEPAALAVLDGNGTINGLPAAKADEFYIDDTEIALQGGLRVLIFGL
jgi:mannose-6-phosphate isomerase